jgi:eukaryotic-like serine/threonine-protein kinase
MSLIIGEVLKDRYRITQMLASGGMGIVYRAMDESLGVEVAIKETLPGGISMDRMQKMAALLASLHHPNLPRVTDTFQLPDDGQILVMDFVPGDDLRTRIEKVGPLPVGKAIEIVSAIGSALQYLHTQNPPVIHQDVKPGNIRITPNGHVMLVDFDLITVLLANQTRPTPEEQGLTPGFAAPEQYNNMADARSDQYGLAATLFFTLTGSRLPDALTRASGESQLSGHNMPSARLPLDISTCLEKALSINPGDRYTDVQAFMDALGSIQTAIPSSTDITTQNLRAKNKRQRNKVIMPIFAGLAVIGVLAAGAFFLFQKPSSDSQNNTQSQQNTIDVSTVVQQPEKTVVPVTSLEPQKPTLNVENPTQAGSVTVIAVPTPLGGESGEFTFVSEKTGFPQIYLGSTANSDSKQLTNIQDGACQPDWSPDGMRIVFTSPCLPRQQLLGKSELYSGSGLFILTIENGNITPLPSLPGGDFDPDWSPDGITIAFTSLRNKFPQIYLYDTSNESTTQLTHMTSGNRQPSWSPNGNTLAFCTSRTGSSQVWLMDKDGSKAREFSVLANGAAFSPDWSPDGKEIIYSQTNSFRLASRKVDEPGAAEFILNSKLNLASNPDYSPDGNWILIDSNIDGSQRVYRITRNGSGLEPITPANEKSYQPQWKPVQ